MNASASLDRQTVRGQFDSKYKHLVRVGPLYSDINKYSEYLNYYEAIDWCILNCTYKFNYQILNHFNEENGDWKLDPSVHINNRSAFFCFEDQEEALIFSIKFKRG